MKRSITRKLLSLTLAIVLMLSLGLSQFIPAAAAPGDTFEFQILFTSDLHGAFYDWSYSTNRSASGLARAATKINELRDENTILVDMGDTIQGNGTTIFTGPTWTGDLYPVLQGMEYLEYDVWVLGNHEFNFGVPALERAYGKGLGPNGTNLFSGAILAGNVFDKDDNPVYDAYWIKEFENGLRVALIGMTNPNIMNWDATNMRNAEYTTKSATTVTEETIKYLKDNNLADVFIATQHMTNTSTYLMEGTDARHVLANEYNSSNIDLFIGGHGHSNTNTMIEGVRFVTVNANGEWLGQVKVTVTETANGFEVVDKEADTNMTTIRAGSNPAFPADFTEGDPDYKEALKVAHEFGVANAITEIGEHIGEPLVPAPTLMGTSEAYLQDTALIHLINNAMLHYTNIYVESDLFKDNNPDYADMKVTLAGTAALEASSNHRPGPITKGSVAGIYRYDNNTLFIMAMTGAQYKQWMEWSYRFIGPFIANGVFDDGPAMVPGDLTIPYGNGNMPGYNMDHFEGVTYNVDLTKPYGERIVDLIYKETGEAFDLEQTYLVALNNYRATTQLTSDVIFGDAPKPVILAEETEKIFPATGEGMLGVMIEYIQNELDGVLDNTDNKFFTPNWKFITPEIDPVRQAAAIERVNAGKIALFPVNGNAWARRAVTESEVFLISDFSDIAEDAWYYDNVEAAINAMLMQGIGGGEFGPELDLTCEMFVTILYRLNGVTWAPSGELEGAALEVPEGEWFTTAVLWALDLELIDDIDDFVFTLGSSITREQMATILYRYIVAVDAAEGIEADDLSDFSDAGEVADWALEAIEMLVGAELLQGYSEDGTLRPAGQLTRAQAATMFIRIIEFLK